ncbi:hypothetical protein CHS0354_004742 [Potamilus streckersoni]|uniref:Uncharacterized protein n=1 Tax=Potamilus streckersoni TaxID=2493646 RepID=A0AAE0TDV8_9BIVA|nr:hypothetical protein CHS0354_004742 [Potamilus streckersoni]
MISTTEPEEQTNESDADAYHNDQQDVDLVVPLGCPRIPCGVVFCPHLFPCCPFRLGRPCAERFTTKGPALGLKFQTGTNCLLEEHCHLKGTPSLCRVLS